MTAKAQSDIKGRDPSKSRTAAVSLRFDAPPIRSFKAAKKTEAAEVAKAVIAPIKPISALLERSGFVKVGSAPFPSATPPAVADSPPVDDSSSGGILANCLGDARELARLFAVLR